MEVWNLQVKYVAELARDLALMPGVFPASYTNHCTNANCKKDAKKSTPCGDRYQREWPLKGLLSSISDNAFQKILVGKDWKVGHRVASTVVGDEEDGVLAYALSFGGGNQLEEEDFGFYDGYEDQVVDLQGAC
nr:protein reticulata-related 5, chloroplastic [Tanacetum cinerariifolium]